MRGESFTNRKISSSRIASAPSTTQNQSGRPSGTTAVMPRKYKPKITPALVQTKNHARTPVLESKHSPELTMKTHIKPVGELLRSYCGSLSDIELFGPMQSVNKNKSSSCTTAQVRSMGSLVNCNMVDFNKNTIVEHKIDVFLYNL